MLHCHQQRRLQISKRKRHPQPRAAPEADGHFGQIWAHTKVSGNLRAFAYVECHPLWQFRDRGLSLRVRQQHPLL